MISLISIGHLNAQVSTKLPFQLCADLLRYHKAEFDHELYGALRLQWDSLNPELAIAEYLNIQNPRIEHFYAFIDAQVLQESPQNFYQQISNIKKIRFKNYAEGKKVRLKSTYPFYEWQPITRLKSKGNTIYWRHHPRTHDEIYDLAKQMALQLFKMRLKQLDRPGRFISAKEFASGTVTTIAELEQSLYALEQFNSNTPVQSQLELPDKSITRNSLWQIALGAFGRVIFAPFQRYHPLAHYLPSKEHDKAFDLHASITATLRARLTAEWYINNFLNLTTAMILALSAPDLVQSFPESIDLLKTGYNVINEVNFKSIMEPIPQEEIDQQMEAARKLLLEHRSAQEPSPK